MADTKAPEQVATPEQVRSYRDLQAEEYGTWVAVQPIQFNNVLAYNIGDPVPVSNVKKFGYDTQNVVAKVGSAEARRVVTALHEIAHNTEPQVILPVTLGVPLEK